MGAIIKFPLYNFFHQTYEAIKKKQDDIKRKKTEFLYKEAYKFFLDLYLMRIAKNAVIDFPPFMYETGKIICQEAQNNAAQAILEIIRLDRIDFYYSKRHASASRRCSSHRRPGTRL